MDYQKAVEELEEILKKAILHGQGVGVPSWVALCPECGGRLWVVNQQWESGTGVPDKTGLEIVCVNEDERIDESAHKWHQSDWQRVIDDIAEFFGAQ